MAWPRWLGGRGPEPAPSTTSAPKTERLPRRRAALVRRGYAGASLGRLHASWRSPQTSADAEIRTALRILRGRSRLLERDNGYTRRFFNLLVKNVVGPDGIRLRVRAREPDGRLDTNANRRIGDSWARWARRGNCTVDGRHSWPAVQRLVLRSVARDGEILVRLVRGYPNDWGFALQLIEADHLDENLHQPLRDGREIRLGVEVDRWRRPIAHWIRVKHPGDFFRVAMGQTHERVPADQILHPFVAERAAQTRGVPWIYAGMARLRMLDGYEEAEVVASRAAAAKMGTYTSEHGDEFDAPETKEEDAQDAEHELLEEFEAGIMQELPRGMKLELLDPKHPTTQVGGFMKAILRGVSSGWDVSYNALANDLEGVNLSSLRHGALDERDGYRVLQAWLVEELCQPVFSAWLDMQLTTGALGLPMAKRDKFDAAVWQPRGWQWVDPQKESRSNREQVAMGAHSITRIAESQGRAFEELMQERADEIQLAEEMGVPLSLGSEFDQAEPEAAPDPEELPEEEPEEAPAGAPGEPAEPEEES